MPFKESFIYLTALTPFNTVMILVGAFYRMLFILINIAFNIYHLLLLMNIHVHVVKEIRTAATEISP